MSPRWLVSIIVLLVACGGGDRHHGIKSAELAPRTCTKDLAWVAELIAQTIPPPACSVDTDCACGSHCNTWGSCEAECVTTDDPTYGCTGDLACDNWGSCSDPDAPPPPQVAPALRVDPLAIQIAANLVETRVDVTLDYAGTNGPVASVDVSGNEDRRIVCPGGAPTCTNPTIEVVHELEVKCTPIAQWSDSCSLPGPWIWQPGGQGLVATQPIWVRPTAGATGTSWELRFEGGGSTANDEAVTVTRAASQTQPFDGRYEGKVTLGDRSLAIEAVASGTELLLVDPTRTLSPSGKVRLPPPPATLRFSWLGDANGALVTDLAVLSRTFAAESGAIDATFRITLPFGGDGRAGTRTSQTLEGHATLKRLGDHVAPACSTSCLVGTTCEPVVGRCLAGTPWQETTQPAANGLADPAYDGWTQAVRPQLTTLGIASTQIATPADAIERLLCYQPDWSASQRFDGVLAPTLMTRSGDLSCASNNAPWVARATIRRDAGDATLDVGDLLTSCLADLEASAPVTANAQTLAKSPCMSLARFAPGLDLALEGALGDAQSSGREATIAQQLVRNWLAVQGFVMQQGDEDVGLAGGTQRQPLAPLSRLLDVADTGWRMLLQAPVAETLMSLDPRHLRAPDYRKQAFAAIHWPGTASTDVIASRALTMAPSCGSYGEANSCDADQTPKLDPLDVDLSGDASVSFRISLEAQRPYANSRYVVDSPALAVRMAFDGMPYRDKGYARSPASYYSLYKPTWYDCRSHCAASGSCLAWTFDTSQSQSCKLHNTIGSRTPKSTAVSGVIAHDAHQGLPASDFNLHWFDTEIIGNDLPSVQASTFGTCFDACSANQSCAAFTWSGNSCLLKSASTALRYVKGLQSAVMPTVSFDVSHVSIFGKAETVRLSIPRTKLEGNGQGLLFDHKVVITRNTGDKYYRAYIDGVLSAQTRYTQTPGRWAGRVRVGRRDGITTGPNGTELPEFEKAEEVAFWATALDDFEVMSIYTRSLSNGQGYASRATLAVPTSVEHDQSNGLPVTLLETLDNYHRLLERQLDDVAGEAYSVCTGADPNTTEAARARVGGGLRRSLLVEQFAGELAHRAREVECDSDTQCTAYNAKCGARESSRVDAMGPAVTRSGAMQNCYGPGDPEAQTWPAGLCVSSGGIVTSPGTVGTATFSFNVATTGHYYVWGRFYAQTGKQSFWVRVDSGPWTQWSTGTSSVSPARWHWHRASSFAQLSPGVHTVTLGVREPGTIVAELALAETAITYAPEQRHDVCVANGEPVLVGLPWQTALDRARIEAKASRERLEERLGQIGRCEPPMGLAELDTPLFFADPGPSAFDRYFASSNYLMSPQVGLATNAVSSAIAAVSTASAALDQSLDDDYQRDLTATERTARLGAIRQQYDAQLGILCGTQSVPANGMLQAISDGSIREDACFVAQTTPCLANAHLPASEATASCYGGAIGEAILAIKATSIDVAAARLDWNARQADLDRKGGFCAELEETGEMIAEHNAYMEKLRKKKAWFDKISMAVSVGAAISTGGLSALTALNNPEELPDWQVGLESASGFMSAFGSGVSLLSSVLGAGAADIQAEQDKWQEVMQARANELDVIQCWNDASAIRDQIGLAQNRIQRATADFELATMRLSNARREESRLVQAGSAELAREQDRWVVRPQHHLWLDERITSYEQTFAWAKRTTYLAVRAIEHDFQSSTGLAPTVLDATNPYQLETVLGQLRGTYANARVWGHAPQPGRAIVRLTELAGIAPGALGDFLQTDRAIIRDRRGVEIGRGVRFSFSPDTTLSATTGLANRRSERLWGMTGSVQVDGELPDTTIAFSLFKRATFFSRWAEEAPNAQTYQLGIHRPSQNLFAQDENGFGDFAEALQMQPSTIHNIKNISEAELFQSEYPAVTVNDFAGQGLYGDYVVMFETSGPDAIGLDHVEDVLLRLDYVSIAGGSTPGP